MSTEFDFKTDKYDIIIPSDVSDTMGAESNIPESFHKLRVRSTISSPCQIF